MSLPRSAFALVPKLRRLLPLCLLAPLLAGCLEAAAGPAAVIGGTSVVLTGRTPIDHVASLVSGQDCSVVRLERRESWCAPYPGAPAPPVFCTRSLGSVDCWTTPPTGAGRSVADPPPPPIAGVAPMVVPLEAPAVAPPALTPPVPTPSAPAALAPASGAPAAGVPATPATGASTQVPMGVRPSGRLYRS